MNMFHTKSRNGEVKIARHDFDKLFKLNYSELNNFIEFELENLLIKSKTRRKSNCIPFVRIPCDLLEKSILNDDDKIGFLLEIMLFTYGLRHKHIRYTIDELFDLFCIIGMTKKEFVEQYCGRKIGNIFMEHIRGKGVFISFK